MCGQPSEPITAAVIFLGRFTSGSGVGYDIRSAATHRVCVGYGVGLTQKYELAFRHTIRKTEGTLGEL